MGWWTRSWRRSRRPPGGWYVDNLYKYGQSSGALTESSPEHGTGKGALGRRIAHRILKDERITASVGRFSDYYGPGGTNSFVHAMFLEPAVAGRRAARFAHQFSAPWVVDSSAFEQAFGPLAVTDHHTAVAETLAWLRTARTSRR